jgi:nucleoside phosphorylase
MKEIRALIVEDQQSKVAKVVEFLLHSKLLSRERIDVAQSGIDARRLLRAHQYDLMILDVVLPNRPEDAPQKEGGVELLRELMDRDVMQRPRYIVGLTAYPEAFQSAAGEFADYTWAIVQYQENENSWQDPIEQLLRHITRTMSRSDGGLEYSSDICVVTALDMELDSLLRLEWGWSDLRVQGDAVTYKQANVSCGGDQVRVIAASCPRMGMVSAAVFSTNIIRTFRPRLIVMTGICAGIRERVSVGDVAVADPSWDYQSGKLVRGGFEVAPHQLPLISALRRRIAELNKNDLLGRIRAAWGGAVPLGGEIGMHIGPFASGSAVLADKDRLRQLREQHRNLIGIDMEVYGVYAAAAEAPAPSPYAFAVKGVSDLGDESKGDEFKEYASYLSASVFREFVLSEYLGLKKFLWR